MVIQQSLVIIKPDGLVKSLTGNIITSLSETKLKIVGAKIVKVTKEFAEKHYAELLPNLLKKYGDGEGKKIFGEVIDYITGKYHTDRVLALVYHGEDAINKIRQIAGETNPEKASPTSIRGKYGRIHSETKVYENVIHASDSEANAEREIKLWFSPSELAETIYPTDIKSFTAETRIWK
ncbi:MAG: nucleoside-diphosphate kinase [Candidatus Pacearchaeota archaeon]